MVARTHITEGINVPRLEQLVRLGLLPLQTLPALRRALDRVQGGVMLTPEDRKVISILLDRLMGLSLNDTTTFQRLRVLSTQNRNTDMTNNLVHEDRRREELKRMPQGMLDTLANNITIKLRSGGKATRAEKTMASRAKSELRRRRENKMSETYEAIFNTILETYGVSSIANLSNDELQEFFIKVEHTYKSQGE